MNITLYSWPQSSGTRIHWALEELGAPYQYVALDRSKQEHRTPAYLAINPNGTVPALVDGGQPYFESLAILLHLGEAYGGAAGLWPPASASALASRAEALCWAVWGTTELHGYMMQYLYHGLDTPVSYAAADRSKATAAYNHAQLLRRLDALEQRLAGREYLLGAFSLTDIPAAAALVFGTALGLGLEGRANVEAWLARCSARPALERVRAWPASP
jgi:glutathione S-transferase